MNQQLICADHANFSTMLKIQTMFSSKKGPAPKIVKDGRHFILEGELDEIKENDQRFPRYLMHAMITNHLALYIYLMMHWL